MIIRNQSQIVVDLPNSTFGTTVIKKKAHFMNLFFDVWNEYGFTRVQVMEVPYAQAEGDTYGESLASVMPAKVVDIETSITAVADATGQVQKVTETVDGETVTRNMTIEEAAAAVEPYFIEPEFYKEIAEKHQINIYAAIIKVIKLHYGLPLE